VKNWLPFEEALGMARSEAKKYSIDSVEKWYGYCKSDKRNKELPSSPRHVYKNKGWVDWFHWLGRDYRYFAKKDFLSFNDALKIVREDAKKYNLNYSRDWFIYCKTHKPSNIPYAPWTTYRDSGWKSMQHWLGTEFLSEFLCFKDAYVVIENDIKKYNIDNGTKWFNEYVSRGLKPKNIPIHPDITYKNKGWISWYHWLRTSDNRANEKYNILKLSPGIIEKYWDFENNQESPSKISPGARTIVNLKCSRGHKWQTSAYGVKSIKGCPDCMHRRGKTIIKEESFGCKYPHLLKHWNYDKNLMSPYDIYGGSGKEINLRCEEGHEWHKRVDHVTSRDRGDDCPYCAHELPSEEYNAAILYPELIQDWHCDNQKKLSDFLPSSSAMIKWKCHICGFEWTVRLAERTVNDARCLACNKIMLKDGTLCDSMIEAYYCLLIKQSEMDFTMNRCYPGLKLRYDFYIPFLNLYIETTSYNGREKWWNTYLEKIKTKKKYVEKNLFANFEFIWRQLNRSEMRFVKCNMY
jgi:hypothetical protein